MQTPDTHTRSDKRTNAPRKEAPFHGLKESILLFFDGIRFLPLLFGESANENIDRR